MDDAHAKMRFSLSPPSTKATSATTSPTMQNQLKTSAKSDEEPTETADDAASDYKQWLHAMKLVARLPGGMPPEFRRKLWLSLADKYLKSKNLDWSKEEEKCFCEKWREDDEELGIQIVKDLHRTGSNLCTGPAGSINQAKLKRILLGYARYNPEVGYCQGFNMLGALILQVMDKEEAESMKVMIYLVEGVLPPGYFCGSMGGLQADMGVFRELMTSKLPRLAKHLQKLQGPIENAYEPPLTNVFTMQWFLTMFCTCLPMTCVLRVWDLVLIEGSDVLLRTALVLWSLLEERILSARTADDFYCKMGSFSSELLNGHLIDSNGLIEKVVQLGPIPDIQRLRDKHLYNIAPLRHKPGLQLYYDDEEPESDEESRLAVATVWGIPWGRRGSTGQAASSKPLPLENKDRIALDISLLKKQYDRLRERQKQAHIILTTACSTAARQGSGANTSSNPSLPVNHLLMGRSAIVTNRGRRIGPPTGAIPPARKPSLPAILQTPSRPPEKQLRRGETLHWRDTDLTKRRKDSLTWKEIKADRSLSRESSENVQSCKLRTRMGKSDSSSYSEESDDTEGSSTDTSLCDEDDVTTSADKKHGSSSKENSPKKRSKSSRKQKELSSKLRQSAEIRESSAERKRPKSWAPSNDEIPFMLMTSDSPQHSGDEKPIERCSYEDSTMREEEDSATESDRLGYKFPDDLDWTGTKYSHIAGDLATTKLDPLHVQTDVLELPMITSMSQLSPLPDISQYLATSAISPMPTPKPLLLDSINSLGSGDGEEPNKFDVSDDGVTNEYFERVNSVERPKKLDLFYSLSEEDSVRNAFASNDGESIGEPEMDQSEQRTMKNLQRAEIEGCEAERTVTEIDPNSLQRKFQDQIRMELLDDYSEKSSVAFIAEATNEVSTSYTKLKERDSRLTRSFDAGSSDVFDIKNENRKSFQRKYSQCEASKKRRDPRRLTISHIYKMETSDTYQRLGANLNDEKSEKDYKINKVSRVTSPAKDDLICSGTQSIIPSTADLEVRFNRLEKQLSEGRNSIDKSTRKASQDKSKTKENISRHDENELTLNHSRLPSIELSEEKFSALEEPMHSPVLGTNNRSEVFECSYDKHIKEISVSPEVSTDTKNEAIASANNTTEVKSDMFFIEKSLQDISPDPENNRNNCHDTSERTLNALIANEVELEKDEKQHQNHLPILTKTDLQESLAELSSEKSGGSHIPSTEELENRFSALEKQMSSQNINKKDAIDITKQPAESENEKNTKKSKNNKNDSLESDDAKVSSLIKSDSSAKNDETKTDPKPRITKIPSTAELEDRFNALERKMSTSKKSPSKSKKEPPDDSTQHQTITDKQKNHKEEKEVSDREQKSAKEMRDNVKGKPEKTDIETKDQVPPTTKPPPTTEELDKRFEAIEKSLSSSNKTHDKKKADVRQASDETQDDHKHITKQTQSAVEFHEKVKKVNEQISGVVDEKRVCMDSQRHGENEDSEKKKQAIKSFQAKSKTINENLSHDKTSHSDTNQPNTISDDAAVQQPSTSKRRASEPPTTEDLENRYEALKRRMSTKTHTETSEKKKLLLRSETVEEALERIEKEVLEETTEMCVEENQEANKISPESLILTTSTENIKRRASEPPTTEALEKRYEKLKRKMSTTTESFYEQREADASPNTQPQTPEFTQNSTKSTEKEHNPEFDQQSTIPIPPPLQANYTPPSIPPKVQSHQSALVRELQSKMIPNDENLKPSDINPNRKIPPHQHATMADDTSETHATTASLRLKNYEPWQMQPQKMVRRFSDLPSRSDLENRVHFLEEQLKLKYVKQRSAGDSDVASRTHFVGLKEASRNRASTSPQAARQESNLESRVKALEKQLSENSLKLIEAMRLKPKERDEHIVEAHVSTAGPKSEGAQPDIRTGMELVRYTHCGGVDDAESLKPINISINIKMHINKDNEEMRKQTASPKAEVLEKRLEALEEKFSKTKQSEAHAQIDKLPVESSEKNKHQSNADSVKKSSKFITQDEEVKIDKLSSEATEERENETDKVVQKQSNSISKDYRNDVPTTSETKPIIETKPIKPNEELEMTESKNQKAMNEKQEAASNPQAIAVDLKMRQKEVPLTETDPEVKDNQNKVVEDNLSTKEEPKTSPKANSDKVESSSSQIELNQNVESNEANSKNMDLPLDTEPTGNKIRRLTRANTEELEGLLQALEIQLSNRNLIKSEGGKLIRMDSLPKENAPTSTQSQEQSEALANLSKEIQQFTSSDRDDKTEEIGKRDKVEKPQEAPQVGKTEKDEYDWGPDPVKRHLKRSTVYLPSTRELEARYRSLERQIKLLEDVEKIDVEQRLNEIERKIKLQYSLSHEKDLSKYLELCEGKLPEDDIPRTTTPTKSPKGSRPTTPHTSPGRVRIKTPHTSPARTKDKTSYSSPSRAGDRSPHSSPSPSRPSKRSPYTSPGRQRRDDERLPTTDDLEYRYRVLDLVRSKSIENQDGKLKKKSALKKQPIHPLEMLLDPSPDESKIPTTGELEHRIRVLDGKCQTPSPPRARARQRFSSPTVEEIVREKLLEEHRPKTPIHGLEAMVSSPTKKTLPTEEELEARMRALEQDQKFDFKMQKNYKEFNQKLKDVISPSLSFEEFKAAKSREQSPKRITSLPKSTFKDHDMDYDREETTCRSTSPKMIRFQENEDECRPRSSREFRIDHRDHQDTAKMTLADSNSSSINECGDSAKGLDLQGPRLMRETSPLRRTGTHTGIPLRTDDNINDRLNSIKNTIKSIDTLCEEKPYHKEKCQRYIDSLFTESVYFASPSKKASLEDLTYKRRSGEYAPSICISDHSLRPSEYLSRSLGSAESLRSISPSRAANPIHHRSTRELRREISPRRHRFDEEHEEFESRVRTRVNLLPKHYLDDSHESLSRSSLTKFYKVDNELETYKMIDDKARSGSRSVSRSPLRSPYGSREMMQNQLTELHHNNNTTLGSTATALSSKRLDLDRPVSPYRQTSHNLLGYDSSSLSHNKSPIYNPPKLEIRHTTVTSTFYDRLLTEKQIEKSLSRPPSRSPLVSPSAAEQSNLDLPLGASALYGPKSSGNSPLTPVRSLGAGMSASGAGLGLAGSGTNYLHTFISNTTTTLAITSTITTTNTNTFNTATPMPTGSNSEFHIRLPTTTTDYKSTEFHVESSANIPTQLNSTSIRSEYTSNLLNTTTSNMQTAITTTAQISASSAISSFNNFLSTLSSGARASTSADTLTIVTTTTTISNTTYNPSISTFVPSSAGGYNSMMPLNLRPPPQIGNQLGVQEKHIP